MGRCPACGATYADDALFCTRDGSRLVGPPGDPPAPRPAGAAPREAGGVDAPPPRTATTLVGIVLDGQYRVEKKIGEGGMSFVYLAHDDSTGERYAIKVLSAALSRDRKAMVRLKREASLGMRLAHPSVCHIIRLGETPEGLVYVVMPYLEGEILSDRNYRKGVLPVGEVVRLVNDMAAGLHVAHELDIVHRDLKPENVMICTVGGVERAVVMDFGLAKERHADAEVQKLTATGMILGTPEFMSPEQLRGKQLDRRSDVYALALMTYEMLTGKLPFAGATQKETMLARLKNEPKPVRQARPDLALNEGIERVLAKGMSREAGNRHATAPEFAAALAAAAGGKSGDGGMLDRLFGR